MRRQPAFALVRLDNVDVDIDGRPVLHGISLSLRPGEHWGFIGPNGSGKSTLLALIAGRRWPAPGRGRRCYDFGDGPERDAVSARERIALLGHELQDLYVARAWNFRVLDVVLSGLTRTDIPQRHRASADIEAAGALLSRLALEHLAARRILELSRGEQRRVLIARALAFDPRLLLLDEPASGLDAGARRELERTLAEVASLTQLAIAAHSAADLPGIVNRVASIRAGRLEIHAGTEGAGEAADAPGAGTVAPGSITAGRMPGRAALPLIRLTQASVWIAGRAILDRLDWTLEGGDHWLVCGANGAGKSTFLRLLHGELRPAQGGSISWPGLGDPRDVWTLRRRVALVSAELQARYRLPTTVFDAVASGFTASIGRTRQLTPEQARRVASLLSAFALGELGDRLLGTLSYGQRHRVLIARMLAPEPRVLLLDEPWEGLDAASAEIVRRALAECMQSGTQIVCVSHVGAGGLALNRRLELAAGRAVSVDGSAEPSENSASALRPESGFRPR